MSGQLERSAQQIGAFAARLGLNPKTVRYYEALGVLPPLVRTERGYRLYGAQDEAHLRFIVKAKAIGLTLAEIRAILALRLGDSPPCDHVLALLDRKVAELDRRLAVLAEVRAELVRVRQNAARTMATPAAVCGIIEAHPLPTTQNTRGEEVRGDGSPAE
jgi:DNA-binding transcriptional MerR regulator